MKNKTIVEILRHKYNEYYKVRGVLPTKFSVWIGYKDEFLTLTTLSNYYTQVQINDGCHYMGIEIKWIKRRRIECLPRRNKGMRFKKWIFPIIHNMAILPDIYADSPMPCISTKIFYKDLKS